MCIAYNKPNKEPTLILVPGVRVGVIFCPVLVSKMRRGVPASDCWVHLRHIAAFRSFDFIWLDVITVLLTLKDFGQEGGGADLRGHPQEDVVLSLHFNYYKPTFPTFHLYFPALNLTQTKIVQYLQQTPPVHPNYHFEPLTTPTDSPGPNIILLSCSLLFILEKTPRRVVFLKIIQSAIRLSHELDGYHRPRPA